MAAGEFPDLERQAFLDAIAIVDGEELLRSRKPREPGRFSVDELPGVALLWTAAPDEDHQTGPATQTTWTWRCNVYADTSRSYEDAQIDLERIVPKLLQAVRRDPSLGVDGIWARLLDPGGDPEFNDEEQLAWKTLRLEIRREETS